jgi:anti-anti-sigma factor
VIRLSGELDMHSARDMAAALSEAVGDMTRALVIDLRSVAFMDSTALGALARAGEQLRNQGRALGLVVAPGQVSDLLASSGLADRFDVLSGLPGAAGGSNQDPATAV